MSENSPKNPRHEEAKIFIQRFHQRMKDQKIIADNIYAMIDMKHSLESSVRKEKKNTNLKMLKDDNLLIRFCTNATGSHIFSPFIIYEYKNEHEHEKDLTCFKNTSAFDCKLQKKEEDEERKKLQDQKNFVDWYDNCFKKLVRENQEKTNIRGKVFLLFSLSNKTFNPENIMQDDSFEIIFIPYRIISLLQPLDREFTQKIYSKLNKMFKNVSSSYDLVNYIETCCKPWIYITPANVKELWKKFFESDFHKIKDSTAQIDTDVGEVSKSSSLSRKTEIDKQKLKNYYQDEAKRFLLNFAQRMKKENIVQDNIYAMKDIEITFKSYLGGKKTTNMEKFKDDTVKVMLCTNATGSHILSPFFIYKYEREDTYNLLKNKLSISLSREKKQDEKKEKVKNSTDFEHFYGDFKKSVTENQQKTNMDKVFLLLTWNYKSSLPKEIIKDNSFEIIFIPFGTTPFLHPLNQKNKTTRFCRFQRAFNDFFVSYDIKKYIETCCKPWNNMTPADVKELWKRFFESDFHTIKDSTTKEDTDVEEVSEPPSSSREIETNKRRLQKLYQDETKRFLNFTLRMKQENIVEDNIYVMENIEIRFKSCLRENETITNMEEFKDDILKVMLCTNATGSHILSPFYIYKYKDKDAVKLLKNKFSVSGSFRKKEQNKKKELENRNDFEDFYNYFTKSMTENQQKSNINNKVFLFLKSSYVASFPRKIIKDNSLEIIFIPYGATSHFHPIDLKIKTYIRKKFHRAFENFSASNDIGKYIKWSCKPWENITPASVKESWKKFFESDYRTTKDNTTEKDTDVEEVSESPSPSREIETDIQKDLYYHKAKKFIQKFTRRMREENIVEDNIFVMENIDIRFKFRLREDEKDIDMEKFKDDMLKVMLCTNATGSHILSPIYIYKHKDEDARNRLKNKSSVFFRKIEQDEKEEKLENLTDFKYFYDRFKKSVTKNQQKPNINNKVFLLLKSSYKPNFPREIIKDNSFEIIFIPIDTTSLLHPIDRTFKQNICQRFRRAFKQFSASNDIGKYIKRSCKPWNVITSADVKEKWKKFFELDCHTLKDNTSMKDSDVGEISGPSSLSRKTDRDKQAQQKNTLSAESDGRVKNTVSIEENAGEKVNLENRQELIDRINDAVDPDELPDILISHMETQIEGRQKQDDLDLLKLDMILDEIYASNLPEICTSDTINEAEECQNEGISIAIDREAENNSFLNNFPNMLFNITEDEVSLANITTHLNIYEEPKEKE